MARQGRAKLNVHSESVKRIIWWIDSPMIFHLPALSWLHKCSIRKTEQLKIVSQRKNIPRTACCKFKFKQKISMKYYFTAIPQKNQSVKRNVW